MKEYEKVDVSEAHLEDLVRRYSNHLEEGLSYVDHQKHTAGGRLDVLLVDSGHSLVVGELKVVQDDGMLFQGLDYYDYITTNIEAFARIYQEHKIDPIQQARLLLIAPSFSQQLINRCKWIEIPVSLFTFQCLRFDGDSEVVPIFADQQIPTPQTIVEIPKIEDAITYITDDEVQNRVREFLSEVQKWDSSAITQDPIQGGISMKVNNRVFAYFHPRRKSFVINTYSPEEEWTVYPVKDDEDLSKVKPIMKAAIERFASSLSNGALNT